MSGQPSVLTRRTLAHIILDLDLAARDRADADKACQRFGASKEDEDKFAAADDRIADLRNEFKTKFHEETGVCWTTVENAISSALL